MYSKARSTKIEAIGVLRLIKSLLLLVIFIFSVLSLTAQGILFSEINQLIANYELEKAAKAIETATQNKKNQADLKVATLRHLQGKLQAAKGEYQAAKAIFEAIAVPNDKHLQNANRIQLAAIYIELQELHQADSLLEISKNTTWEYNYQLGLLRLAQQEYEVADSLFEQLLVSNSLSNIQLQARYRLGESKLEQGQFLAADSLLHLTLTMAQDVSPIVSIYIQNYLGRLKTKIGAYDEAEVYFQAGLALVNLHLPSKHPYKGKLLYGLGRSYLKMGKFKIAEEKLQTAQSIYLNTYGKSPLYAHILSGLEVLYEKLGQQERALDYALQQKEIYLQAGDLREFARVVNNLSYSYQNIEEYDKSDSLLLDAIARLEAAQFTKDRYYGLLHMNYGIGKWEQKAYQQAKSYLEVAQQQFETLYGRNHPWYAAVINYLAVLYEKLEDYDKAEQLHLETQKIDSTTLGVTHPYYVNTLYNIARFYRLRTQDTLAIDYFNAANQGQIDLIYNYYSGFDEQTRLDYLKQTDSDFHRFYSYALEQPDLATQAQNVSLAIKNLALDFSRNQQSLMTDVQDSTILPQYEQWRSVKRTLAESYIKTPAQLTQAGIDIDAIELEAERLEKALIRSDVLSENQLSTPECYTFADLKTTIAADEATIDFLRFQYHAPQRKTDSIYYVALVSRHDFDAPKMVFLAEEKKLRRLLRSDVRRNTNNYIENPQITQALYAHIWQPLAEYVQDAKSIHIAASGLLHKLAFAALPTTNGLLLDQHQFVYHGNLRAFIASKTQKTKRENKSICLLGGAFFDLDSLQLSRLTSTETIASNMLDTSLFEPALAVADSLRSAVVFNYLPGTVREVTEIEQQFKAAAWQTSSLTGKQALEETIKQLEGKAAPHILHLATHGYFFPLLKKGRKVPDNGRGRIMAAKNPLLRSGLACYGANYIWKEGKSIPDMEDGILTAYEIANLNLTNTQLAVLSACETALGDVRTTEGVFGLQRAFKMAGVNQLLISLWKVPDEQTTELMRLFYQNYLQNQDAASALYRAQQRMNERYSAFDWAAFVLLE